MSWSSNEYRVEVGYEPRPGRLAPRPSSDRLTVEQVASLIRVAGATSRLRAVVLGAGEPTLRPDLLEVVAAAAAAMPAGARLVLETDGLALRTAGPAGALRSAGLDAVRIPIAGARLAMQDWVVGVTGHGRRVLRAIRTATAVGLEVAVDCLLTRPGLPLLAETVSAVAHLGAREVRFRVVGPGDVPADDRVALVPRVGLLAAPLTEAARTALGLGLSVRILGVPRCLLPRELQGSMGPGPADAVRCASCDPSCPGVTPAYVDLFGPGELLHGDRETPAVRVVLRALAPIACAACGDVDAGVERAEPRRDARVRLLRAARRRPGLLRLASAGSLWHPAARELLREVARLDVEAVEVSGDVAALAAWSDDDLHRIRRLGAVHGAFYGPTPALHDEHVGRDGAFGQSRDALERLSRLGVSTHAYGVIHHGEDLDRWATAWGPERLPGTPAFRLSPSGGALQDLCAAAGELPPGPARSALQPLLPACMRADQRAVRVETGGWSDDGPGLGGSPPSGSDRCGTWEACPEAEACRLAAVCPGLATGWTVGRLEAVA